MPPTRRALRAYLEHRDPDDPPLRFYLGTIGIMSGLIGLAAVAAWRWL